MMSRVLFVDDDPDVLDTLRATIETAEPEWEGAFAGSGEEALGLMASLPVDVIVSDMVMPAMDGAQLLQEVMRRHPGVVRIILSGYAEEPQALRSAGLAHQYLMKPLDYQLLSATIARAGALRALLADPRLQQVVARMGTLPSLPALYVKLQEACRASDVSLGAVANIVEQDAAMTAKMLQLVNSAFFGLRRRVASPLHAVQLLGIDMVKTLALSAHVFFGVDPLRLRACALGDQWSHGLLVGTLASRIAAFENADPETVEHARVAGLLHDTGCLVLASSTPGAYSQVIALARSQGLPLAEAETQRLGVSHAAVGAYLLGLWGLPEAIVRAVAFHHTPGRCPGGGFDALAAVHVGDALAHELYASHVIGAPSALDAPYLDEAGLLGQLPAWREACRAAVTDAAA
jgi:HD-like signal output (HDOD) protein/ActR/RegA family two-component response regulator